MELSLPASISRDELLPLKHDLHHFLSTALNGPAGPRVDAGTRPHTAAHHPDVRSQSVRSPPRSPNKARQGLSSPANPRISGLPPWSPLLPSTDPSYLGQQVPFRLPMIHSDGPTGHPYDSPRVIRSPWVASSPGPSSPLSRSPERLRGCMSSEKPSLTPRGSAQQSQEAEYLYAHGVSAQGNVLSQVSRLGHVSQYVIYKVTF